MTSERIYDDDLCIWGMSWSLDGMSRTDYLTQATSTHVLCYNVEYKSDTLCQFFETFPAIGNNFHLRHALTHHRLSKVISKPVDQRHVSASS